MPPVLTDCAAVCRCVLPRLQNNDTEPGLPWQPHWYFMFLCERNFDLCSPVGSDDPCAVLRPLCGLRLLSVCVCMFVHLFSFHVRTVGVHTENGDTFANVN